MVSLCIAIGAPSNAGPEHEVFPLMAERLLKYVQWDGEAKVEQGKRIRLGVYDRTRGERYFEGFSKICEKYPLAYELIDLTESSSDPGS